MSSPFCCIKIYDENGFGAQIWFAKMQSFVDVNTYQKNYLNANDTNWSSKVTELLFIYPSYVFFVKFIIKTDILFCENNIKMQNMKCGAAKY